MLEKERDSEVAKLKVHYNKKLWPLYLLNGLQSVAYGGLIVLVVPLAEIFWPLDPADMHSFEMGMLYSILAWSSSFGGLFFGRLIDKFSRKWIIIIMSLFRGFPIMMLGFATPGQGLSTWTYFLFFIAIFGFFAGGWWPAVISISNDVVPRFQRSRFFGIYEIVRNTTTIVGWLFATSLVQNGYWREFFWGIGILILLAGLIFTLHNKEPKRGAFQEELYHVLKDDKVIYNFQIDKEMIKKTMLSKTNIVALIEGIFTWILMSSLNFLILNFIQTPPINIAPFSTSVFLVVFGLTGGLVGQLILARLSDKIAEKKPIYRLPIIVVSIIGGLITFAAFFFLPWYPLTPAQGENIGFLLTLPIIWAMGILFFTSRSVFSLYVVNQSPILQEINLPEAQGQIISWNQFLESFGRGIGPILCGIILSITGDNYQISVLIVVACIFPGVILWILALRWYPSDRIVISDILEERAEILENERASK
ncbi:MAG: MFS transporter [Candidatus Lokiarchaeota archaeon]|nr:MFS transporter [Candidatus Lokiarchaeota archaeon]MBD3202570.1 MFS transporter [Candidatus Lokiarchaeota archaeon]